jgi:methylmalonyl-CoA mutase C-terminal domain/subunit
VTGAERLRVVVAGPDGPGDSRAVAVARALRDAGAEVVLTGAATAAGRLAATAVQEDADAVVVTGPPPGLPAGLLAGLLAGLAAAGADDVTVAVLGDPGNAPAGVLALPDGTPPDDVVAALLRTP